MADLFGQYDNQIRGGADVWDDGLAGQILLQDYFPAPAPVSGGLIKVWTGLAWVLKPIKVWTGLAWIQKPLKRWTGSAWVLT